MYLDGQGCWLHQAFERRFLRVTPREAVHKLLHLDEEFERFEQETGYRMTEQLRTAAGARLREIGREELR
ncbi:MAG: hypothetical protein M1136_04510 [Chloroflexi bacterium]|nr:hypothetical protein [Chloroflexota bacterium]MCL5074902.1 hypothetical protein [Chloroflexota bacterium]